MTKKLMVFIDGQNLFYGCKSFQQGFQYDVDKLIDVLKNLEPDRELVDVCYYGSLLPPNPDIKGDDLRWARQQAFYEMLKYKFRTLIKQAQPRQTTCKSCGATFTEHKEKGIDVALATDYLLYGLMNEYDVAIIVSGDSDLAPVIRKLRDRKPSIRTEVAQFKQMVGNSLRQECHKFHELDPIAEKFRKQK